MKRFLEQYLGFLEVILKTHFLKEFLKEFLNQFNFNPAAYMEATQMRRDKSRPASNYHLATIAVKDLIIKVLGKPGIWRTADEGYVKFAYLYT